MVNEKKIRLDNIVGALCGATTGFVVTGLEEFLLGYGDKAIQALHDIVTQNNNYIDTPLPVYLGIAAGAAMGYKLPSLAKDIVKTGVNKGSYVIAKGIEYVAPPTGKYLGKGTRHAIDTVKETIDREKEI